MVFIAGEGNSLCFQKAHAIIMNVLSVERAKTTIVLLVNVSYLKSQLE